MDYAIQIKNLHKKFSIPREKRTTLKENILHFHRRVGREDFQVLNNINLDIQPGDFLGIIGKNGSGKSTLLKIIANIYKPTSGDVFVNGTVSPFLELGIGFNGDLSAHENVYLNGIILGLDLSLSLRVTVGEYVRLSSPLGTEPSPFGLIPRSKRLKVVGIFVSGMPEYDRTFTYISINKNTVFAYFFSSFYSGIIPIIIAVFLGQIISVYINIGE